jgi:hypothetical protein
MSDIERVRRAKDRADSSAYKQGLREGWDQAAWAFFAICIFVFVLLRTFG